MNNHKYRKDEIVKIIDFIYKEFENRENISDIIQDLIGKYSEPRRNHKFCAKFISQNAKKELRKSINELKKLKTNISLSEAHKILGALVHEHMTPKYAVFNLLEKNKDTNNATYIRMILEKCCETSLITKDENSRLKKTEHRDLIEYNFDYEKFNIKSRYEKNNFRDAKKEADEIILEEFNIHDFL